MIENIPLDPRVNAFRPDMADVSLKPFVKAERYVEPRLQQCVCGIVPLLVAPDPTAPRISEIRYGEFVDVLEQRANGYAWVQNRNDRAVGYMMARDSLSEGIAALMNRINVLHTFVYAKPDLNSPVIDRLTLGSYVSLDGDAGDYYPLASGGFVFKKHVAPTDEVACADYVFTAGQLLNVPYLQGGRTPLGIDGAGLVQFTLDLAGYDCPRFDDQQRETFGRPLPCHWRDAIWRRGDLVFFEGHAGIMTGFDHIINADPSCMQVVVEPLADLVGRGHTILAAGRP